MAHRLPTYLARANFGYSEKRRSIQFNVRFLSLGLLVVVVMSHGDGVFVTPLLHAERGMGRDLDEYRARAR